MTLASIADDRWSRMTPEERNVDLHGRPLLYERAPDTIWDKIRRQMPDNAPADFEALMYRIITRAEAVEALVEKLEERVKHLEEAR